MCCPIPSYHGNTALYLLANPNIKWSFFALSRNPSITMYDVLANSELPWYYNDISHNKTIVKQYKECMIEIRKLVRTIDLCDDIINIIIGFCGFMKNI